MPSTYIVITRKTLQSLPNSFANPLVNWFFHLSSYVRVSYEHIYIYIFVTYSSVCISAGRMKKKKKKKEGKVASIGDLVRHAQKSPLGSRVVRFAYALHSSFWPICERRPFFWRFFALPSTCESSRVESRRGARRIRGCVDRKENIRKWNRRSKLFLFSSAFRSRTKCFTETSRLKVVPKFSFFFLRLLSSSDSSNVLRMEKIHFRIYEK